MEIKSFMDGNEVIEELEERITGRYIAETITDPDTGEVVVKANHMVTPKRAAAVMKLSLIHISETRVLCPACCRWRICPSCPTDVRWTSC